MAPLFEVELTWSFIYFVMALPAILMLSNFVFGSCTVSDMVDDISGKGRVPAAAGDGDGGDAASKKSSAFHQKRRRNGKLIVAVMFAVTMMQPFVFLGLVNGGRCNLGALIFKGRPHAFRWEGSSHSGGGSAGTVGVCDLTDLSYVSMWLLTIIMFAACILSNPTKEDTQATKGAASAYSFTHRCGTCNTTVPHHDHHCLFINNCVGKANYKKFFVFMTCVSTNALYILYHSWGILFSEGSWVDIVLGLFTCVIFMGISALLVFHVLLCRKGVTTSYLLKNKKGAWSRLRFLLF